MDRNRGHRALNQVEIETMIATDVATLEEATEVYGTYLTEEANAEVDYDELRSRLYLTARGTVRDKEKFAEEQSAAEQRIYLVAQAKAKAQREVLRMLITRIDALRSLNSNVRAQV